MILTPFRLAIVNVVLPCLANRQGFLLLFLASGFCQCGTISSLLTRINTLIGKGF